MMSSPLRVLLLLAEERKKDRKKERKRAGRVKSDVPFASATASNYTMFVINNAAVRVVDGAAAATSQAWPDLVSRGSFRSLIGCWLSNVM